MARFEIELRRTFFELHHVEASDEKEALAILVNSEDTLFHEEEESTETLSCKILTTSAPAKGNRT